MLSIKPTIKLTETRIKQLQKMGFRKPKNATAYDYDYFCKGDKSIRICTFFNGDNLPVKRLKVSTDIKTDKKEVLARFYHYLGEKGDKRKLKEINQYNFNENNECTGNTNWRFYHPKSGNVRFSMIGKDVKRNNFIESDGVYTDINGIKFRPVSIAEYLDIKRNMGRKHFVDEPWTVDQSITVPYGATDSVQECTAIGILGKKGISIDHINPNHPANYRPGAIGNMLKKQLTEQGKNAKAFIIGSCDDDYKSKVIFEHFDDFFTVMRVPHSKYKTGDSVLYRDFRDLTRIKTADSKRIKYGDVTPFYYQSGQHFAYENGEVKITNPVIDNALENGIYDPEKLIKKSFQRHS